MIRGRWTPLFLLPTPSTPEDSLLRALDRQEDAEEEGEDVARIEEGIEEEAVVDHSRSVTAACVRQRVSPSESTPHIMLETVPFSPLGKGVTSTPACLP